MSDYLVTWTIDIEAESAEEAAEEALKIQRDPHSEATFFSVRKGSAGSTVSISVEKALKWTLFVYMDTDDDAQVYYEGKLYCSYADNLNIVKHFKTRELAIDHLRKSVRVIYGDKATKFTADWLSEAVSQLVRGEDVASVSGNLSYSASLSCG